MSTLNRLIYTATPRGIKYRSGIRYVDYTQENIAFSYLCWNVQKASVWYELIDMHILHIWQVSMWGKVQNWIMIKIVWLMIMPRENFSTDLQLCQTWEKNSTWEASISSLYKKLNHSDIPTFSLASSAMPQKTFFLYRWTQGTWRSSALATSWPPASSGLSSCLCLLWCLPVRWP